LGRRSNLKGEGGPKGPPFFMAVRFLQNGFIIEIGLVIDLLANRKDFYLRPKTETCVVCKKSKPEVTFKKRPHAIPEGLGNKSVLIGDECDGCNEGASKYENDLMNFLTVYRTFAPATTKGGRPKFKFGKQVTKVLGLNRLFQVHVEQNDEEPMVLTDLPDGSKKFELSIPAYRISGVARALARQILLLYPQAGEQYPEIFGWLANEPITGTAIVRMFIPGGANRELRVGVMRYIGEHQMYKNHLVCIVVFGNCYLAFWLIRFPPDYRFGDMVLPNMFENPKFVDGLQLQISPVENDDITKGERGGMVFPNVTPI
jgi:hypothetical protein